MKTLNDHSMYSTTHFFVTYKITMETLRNKNYQRLSIFILEKVIKNTTLIHVLNNLSSICFQQLSYMELQQQFRLKSQLPIKSYISKFIGELNWFTEIILCKKEAYCKETHRQSSCLFMIKTNTKTYQCQLTIQVHIYLL